MDEHLLRFDKEKTLVFIDCETLNLCLNSCSNLPWQISMLKVKGDKSIAEKDFYIKWDTHLKISDGAARITRYSQTRMDKLGIPPEEAFPTIKDWLAGADYILGHNVLGFDIYLIKDFYEYMGENYRSLTPKFIDTMCLAKAVKLGLEIRPDDDLLTHQYKAYHTRRKGVKTNLMALGKEFEIDHDYASLHNALVDLKLNLKVWNKLKWMIEV